MAKARRTGNYRAASAVVTAAVALWTACALSSTEREYSRLVAEYRRGNPAPVAAEASRAAARLASKSPRWHWEFRLLAAEAFTALADTDKADKLLAGDPPQDLPAERIRAWIDRAQLHLKDAEGARALLRKVRAAAPEGELSIRANLVEGNLEFNAAKYARAEQLYRSALALAVKTGDLYYQANALNNLSAARRNQNQHEEAIRYALESVAVADRAGALRMGAAAHGSLGTSYAYLGDFEAGVQHEQQAIRIDEQLGLRGARMRAIGELAVMYDRVGRLADAIPQHERAFQLGLELHELKDAARFAENLAHSLIKMNDWQGADQWNERAWELATRSGAKTTLPFLLRNRADIANGLGRPDEAAKICGELLRAYAGQPIISWEAHHLLARLHSEAHRNAAANREFEAALADIDASRSELLDPRYRVTLLSRLIAFYRDYVDSLVAQGSDAKALAVAESSRARVLSERLGREIAADRVADPEALRAMAQKSGASVLAYWVAPARSFAWLITAAGVRRFDLPPESEIEAAVTAYRAVVEHSVADPMQEPAGKTLWDKVLAPAAREIAAGSRVIVVPDGPLHRLNLETLPAGGDRPHYWIQDVELAVAPSVSFALAPAGAEAPDASLLVIGAPDYKGAGYQPLPGAAAEVEALQRRFTASHPKVITGKAASPAAYRAAGPARYSLIHFAAHAEANSEKPLESAVVLSRAGDSFKLYASDVIDIPIHADLVTLSGCRGAGVRAYAGEGLMGFAWAFLHAGAHAVVAGLWDVSDSVTAPLMARFYDGIAARRPPAAALREAKLQLLRDPRYARPFFWAAFQTYIGGQASGGRP